MYFLFTLFFTSLLGIAFMIGRKLLIAQGGQTLEREKIIYETPPFEEWKYSLARNIRRYGYAALVAIIRLYFRSLNFLKKKYQEIKDKMKSMYVKKSNNNPEEKTEASKFLKIIGEYKHKIREIKQKVKEEENNS